MRLFSLFSKKKKAVDSAARGGCMTLANNFRGVISGPHWNDVARYLEQMAVNPEEFLTLTLPAPVNGIRYMQACLVEKGVSVQLGLEKEGAFTLVEAVCDLEQTGRYFDDFYHNGVVRDADAFQPMMPCRRQSD